MRSHTRRRARSHSMRLRAAMAPEPPLPEARRSLSTVSSASCCAWRQDILRTRTCGTSGGPGHRRERQAVCGHEHAHSMHVPVTMWSRGRGRPPSRKRTRPPVPDVQAEAGSRARAKAAEALLGVVCRRALKLILARAAGAGAALLGDRPDPGARGRAALATCCTPARRALQRPTAAGVGQRSAPPRTPVHWEPQCGVSDLHLRAARGEPAHWSSAYAYDHLHKPDYLLRGACVFFCPHATKESWAGTGRPAGAHGTAARCARSLAPRPDTAVR